MNQDENLTCRSCGKTFVFTAGEKEFYAEKGFANKPSRCPECRKSYKASRSHGARGEKTMYVAVCDDCKKETQVPFKPRGDRPVYCSECFIKHR
ncbi:MAG: zinc-ribbon domain containing protein [Firmicutes bacterium]|nr:zinc-ribbon domain containing protein [Bacillota bacterium]MDD4263157.1 zinc-ribbon domain containing protein [Bacillota bacterium]MDD4694235.1 zinc-ribbon domain containing protein [Bacillota bacterium]